MNSEPGTDCRLYFYFEDSWLQFTTDCEGECEECNWRKFAKQLFDVTWSNIEDCPFISKEKIDG